MSSSQQASSKGPEQKRAWQRLPTDWPATFAGFREDAASRKAERKTPAKLKIFQ